ncbi:MAG: SpoIIE family protein phosphatase [Victivallaceae bacterium]
MTMPDTGMEGTPTMENEETLFVDLAFSQRSKKGENICGDAFKYQKRREDGQLVAVLSDGLGSGVKANILASMTATMALKFETESEAQILHTAEIMMDALPICQVRKISYATFTIVHVGLNGIGRIIEMGNPEFILFHNGVPVEVVPREMASPKWQNRAIKIYDLKMSASDRLIFFSDGISQAGMGTAALPLGWHVKGCAEFVKQLLSRRPDISSHELSEEILREALRKEPGYMAGDDMTCGVAYFRHPKKMLLFTGPPFDRKKDAYCAETIATFDGDIVICGGTTAEIISRELKRELTMDLSHFDTEIPPMSKMDGIELVTEGIFTLTKTAQYLENFDGISRENPAGRLTDILLKNDIIEILVGTRINEAHQDPNLPLDLELRRNIVKRIAAVLEKVFLKEVDIKYV